jgi:hypothetical protein
MSEPLAAASLDQAFAPSEAVSSVKSLCWKLTASVNSNPRQPAAFALSTLRGVSSTSSTPTYAVSERPRRTKKHSFVVLHVRSDQTRRYDQKRSKTDKSRRELLVNGTAIHHCTPQLPGRHQRHLPHRVGRGYDVTGVPVASMEIFCNPGAKSHTNCNGNPNNNADGDTKCYAQSDTAASPGSASSPDPVKIVVGVGSGALPFGRLWYGEPNALGYAKGRLCFRSGEMAFPIPCGTVRHVISCIGTDWTVIAPTEFQRRSLRMPQVHA